MCCLVDRVVRALLARVLSFDFDADVVEAMVAEFTARRIA